MDKEHVAHIYNGILLSHKEKRNWVICSEVDGPRVCHTEWSKSEREKQISYVNAYIWNQYVFLFPFDIYQSCNNFGNRCAYGTNVILILMGPEKSKLFQKRSFHTKLIFLVIVYNYYGFFYQQYLTKAVLLKLFYFSSLNGQGDEAGYLPLPPVYLLFPRAWAFFGIYFLNLISIL